VNGITNIYYESLKISYQRQRELYTGHLTVRPHNTWKRTVENDLKSLGLKLHESAANGEEWKMTLYASCASKRGKSELALEAINHKSTVFR